MEPTKAAAAAAAASSAVDAFDLDEILGVAKQAALLAGAEIRQAIMSSTNTPRAQVMQKSDTTDLVTETDERCEKIVTALLQERYPQHLIIGEEAAGAECHYELTNAPTWTIDPIGTYLHVYSVW